MKKTFSLNWLLLAGLTVVMVGCNEPAETIAPGPAGVSQAGELYVPTAQAGVDLQGNPSEGLDTVQQIADNRNWVSRSDPFALLPSERSFEQQQLVERILEEGGGFSLFYEPPEEDTTPPPTVTPRPNWRLAGIVVSDGAILALLDKSPGVEVIRPGSVIEGTNWVCVSIDTDRAVFRRPGNELPNEITVPISAPLGGGVMGGGSGGNTGGGPGPSSGGGPTLPGNRRS